MEEGNAEEIDDEGGEENENELAEVEIISTDESDEDREPTEKDLEELLLKNTESFKCLTQVVMSRSSLLNHPLYHFPPLSDPGIDAAFNYVEPPELKDDICIEKYKKLCKNSGIVPLSRVINSLPTETLDLSFYGLTTKQMKCIADTLTTNKHIKVLNIEENYLKPEDVKAISDMLQVNSTIKMLNLKECRIGPQGAKQFGDGIDSSYLKELDLSKNDLGVEGIRALSVGLVDNSTIRTLNLSRNDLDDTAADVLAKILQRNDSIEDLDLSWNDFSSPQAMKVLFNNGFAQNDNVKSINMAWCGLENKLGMKFLAKYLKTTEMLQLLNLSNNRITGIALKMLMRVVQQNKSLLELNLGQNPVKPEEVPLIIEPFNLGPNQRPKIQVLNLQDVYINKNLLPDLERVKRLGVNITIGGVLQNYVIEGPDIPKLLFERCKFLALKAKKKKARKDFGHFILALPDKSLRKQDFEGLLKKFKMKQVDVSLVNSLCQAFKYKKYGVDCVLMKETYLRLYPDTCPPKKKQKKRRKKKKKRGNLPDTIDTDVKTDMKTDVTTTTDVASGVNVDTDVAKVTMEVIENPREETIPETVAEEDENHPKEPENEVVTDYIDTEDINQQIKNTEEINENIDIIVEDVEETGKIHEGNSVELLEPEN